MAKSKKTSVWVTNALEKLRMQTEINGKPFSTRLSDVAERYEAIISNVTMPDITEDEKAIMKEVFADGRVSPTKIKYLHEEIEGAVSGTPDQRKKLAEKVMQWSPAEKVMYLEKADNEISP